MDTYDGVVDIDQDSGVRGAICTWERNERAGRSTPSTHDGDLAAGEVELSASLGLRHVQADVLHTEQIVTTGRGRRDGEGDSCVTYPNHCC